MKPWRNFKKALAPALVAGLALAPVQGYSQESGGTESQLYSLPHSFYKKMMELDRLWSALSTPESLKKLREKDIEYLNRVGDYMNYDPAAKCNAHLMRSESADDDLQDKLAAYHSSGRHQGVGRLAAAWQALKLHGKESALSSVCFAHEGLTVNSFTRGLDEIQGRQK